MTPEIVLLNDLPDYGVTASGAVWSRKYGTWRELKLQKHPKTGYWFDCSWKTKVDFRADCAGPRLLL